LGLQTEILL